jgi:hypothetical protein
MTLDDTAQKANNELRREGADGFELVSTAVTQKTGYLLIQCFRRPIL